MQSPEGVFVHHEKPSAPSITSRAPLVSAVAPMLIGEMLLLWDQKLPLGLTGNKLCPRVACSLKKHKMREDRTSEQITDILGCSMQSAALQLSKLLLRVNITHAGDLQLAERIAK